MASGIFMRAKANWFNKETDMEADGINCALMNSASYSFNASYNTWSQVSVGEVDGTGYVAGGSALTTKSVTQASSTKFDADDVSWAGSTITARYAILYNTSMANNDLIACVDFGSDKTTSGTTFTIQWSSSGIITIS